MAARALLAQLVEHLHGKEGVDGSSPSEGSKSPANRDFVLSVAESRVRRGSTREAKRRRLEGLLRLTRRDFAASWAAKVALRSHVLRLVAYVWPASWASRAIWTRLLSSSFSSTRETCAFTVATLM